MRLSFLSCLPVPAGPARAAGRRGWRLPWAAAGLVAVAALAPAGLSAPTPSPAPPVPAAPAAAAAPARRAARKPAADAPGRPGAVPGVVPPTASRPAAVPPPIPALSAPVIPAGSVPAPIAPSVPGAPVGADEAGGGTGRKPVEISIPLPVGETSRGVRIPQRNVAGELLSLLSALTIKRLDNDSYQLQEAVINLYHPDGKSDYRIALPASRFDMRTHVISSENPVSIATADFDLAGERMEFDTLQRRGRLVGWVKMTVHNLNKVAGNAPAPGAPGAPPAPASAPSRR